MRCYPRALPAFSVASSATIATLAALASIATITRSAQAQPPAQSAAPASLPRKASLPSDSIVAWAADTSRSGTLELAILLDAMDARIEPDGTGTRTMRSVVHVLQQSAVNNMAERRFTWQPSRQDLTIDWVRVLRPDGTVVSDAPSTDQTADATANMQNPMYVDSRTRRMSLSGVAANTIVDVQYTITDRAPWRTGDFMLGWSFSPVAPTRVSQLRVSAPVSFAPFIRENNLTFKRREGVQDGRRIYEWRTAQPRVVRPAPYAPATDDVRMNVVLAAPQPWDSVTTWYDRLASSRYVADDVLIAKLDSIARGARTRADSLRALHNWIAQDIRYVSVSLGLGGYQPRTPAEVLATGYGDCKDKSSLFIAAARYWGMDARPVLLHLNGARGAYPVSISRFNHVIVAVADPDSSVGTTARYTFTDLTAALIPFGNLPLSYRGSFGVVVRPDGSADAIEFPDRSVDSTGSRVRMIGTLAADGRMDLAVDDMPTGDLAWAMRAAFAAPLDSTRRATGMRSLAATYLPESTADSLRVFDGRDFTDVPRIRAVLRGGRGARAAGPVWLLHLPTPFRSLVSRNANTAREIEALGTRVLPIDARQVIGPRTIQVEYRVTLPVGWTAQLPPPIAATSFFGRYESSYRMNGRELIMQRTLQGVNDGIYPAERIAEVTAWMRAVATDDIEYITLMPRS